MRCGRSARLAILCAFLCLFLSISWSARAAEERLEIYWVDVEGGAATLIVTPEGESILIDTGMPGERDPARIHELATEVAGLERIDHLVVTHFDIDHFGGTADLASKMPIARVYDPGLPGRHPFDRVPSGRFERYLRATKGKRTHRTVLAPGDEIPLKQTRSAEEGKAPQLTVRCLASGQKFVSPRRGQVPGEGCEQLDLRDVDRSENRNSIVLLFVFGSFEFLDAADLTWNLERQLACPINLVGKVDVYQVNHHGLDQSNNPVLIRSIEPRVAVMNNGPTKGCMPRTFRTLKETPSIEAIYQLHRNLRAGDDGNTQAEYIANRERDCKAEHVKLSVDPRGTSYTVSVPATGHQRTYQTK